MGRFKEFTDDEIYMLRRMAMESSWNIVMKGKHSEEEVKLHNDLLNEIHSERKIYND